MSAVQRPLHRTPFRSRPGDRFDCECVDDDFGAFIHVAEAPAMQLGKVGAHRFRNIDRKLQRCIAARRAQTRAMHQLDPLGMHALFDQCILRAHLEVGQRA